jgi:hypothetical protein
LAHGSNFEVPGRVAELRLPVRYKYKKWFVLPMLSYGIYTWHLFIDLKSGGLVRLCSSYFMIMQHELLPLRAVVHEHYPQIGWTQWENGLLNLMWETVCWGKSCWNTMLGQRWNTVERRRAVASGFQFEFQAMRDWNGLEEVLVGRLVVDVKIFRNGDKELKGAVWAFLNENPLNGEIT